MGFMALLILFQESADIFNAIYAYTTLNNNDIELEDIWDVVEMG